MRPRIVYTRALRVVTDAALRVVTDVLCPLPRYRAYGMAEGKPVAMSANYSRIW
jgi:hypothetical protein